MAAELPWERLPVHLSYGVTRDGRIFFIDDRLQTTSWLHPLKGKAVQTGHRTVPGLPAGWEQAVSPEGAIYFIDHNRGTTTFDHPVSGQPVHYEPPSSPKSPPQSPTDKQTKSPSKLRPLKAPPAKRDSNAMVSIKGWLYKQETGGWKSWKKRWCVLSNFGLFFYKDDKEEHTLGSILLPSYRIEMCLPSETSKKYAFKCEHNNMKTYMFASDSQDDRDRWVEALKYAAMLKNPPSKSETEKNNNNTKLIPKSPFMTWDDEEDDEDYSPQNKEFWQGDLISAKQPSPGGQTSPQQYPPYQNGQGSHPHSNNQSEYNPYQGQGNDPRYSGHDPRIQGPQSRDPSGNVRNSYSVDPRDPRLNRDISPQGRNSGSMDRIRPQRPDYDHWENHPNGYDPHHGMGGPNHNNLRDGSQDPRGQFPPEVDPSRHSLSLRSDQYNPSYREPRSDHSPSGRGYDPQRPNYSDAAYDRTDGRTHFPNQQNSPGNQPGNNPDPQHHYNPHNMENYARLGHHGQQYPSQDDPQQRQNPLKREHANKKHISDDQSRHYSQDYPSMSDMQDPYRGQNPNSEFEGYYSPKAESKHRELAQRPLPEIRHNNSLQGRHTEHSQQRSDPDDGYSTLTKYQDRHKRERQPQQQSPSQQDYPEQDIGRYPPQDQFHSQQHYPEQNRERYPPQDQFQSQQQDRGRYPPQDQYQSEQQDRGRYPPQDQYQTDQLYPGQEESQIQRQQQQPSYTDPRSDRYDGPHTYVNLPERRPQITVENLDLEGEIPGRPPLPTAVRQQIVEELAQTKTPNTSKELLEAERNLELRMQRPSYFDYPTPTLPTQESKVYGSQRSSLARHQAEDERQAGIHPQAGSRDYHREQYSPGDPRHRTIPKQVYAEQDSYDSREDSYRNRMGDSHDSYSRNQDVQDSYRNRPNEDPFSGRGETLNPYKRSQDMQDPYGRREDPYNSRREGDPRSMQGQPRQPQDDRRSRQGEQKRGRKLGESKLGPIQTVKEDPDMPDDDIIETRALPNLNKKFPLSGPRLRMSISAGDLIGKTHDELVLLLIQLRRDHSSLEKTRTFYRKGIDKKRPAEQHYRRLLQESDGPFDYEIEREHREYMNLKKECEEIEKKLEVYRPLVNLVHNMVNMGSLYGGDNFMLASQYRKHLLSPDEITPAKKMLEFSRQHQEDRIIKDMNDEIKQLTAEEVDLEEKLERLYELDSLMQEQSHMVTSEQEDKEILEKALQGILRQQDMNRDNPRELDKLIQQQRTIEREISKKMHQLARISKELEATTAENNKIEHEVALLRTKVHGELSRSKSAPSLSDENMRTKMKMEKDLAKVQNMMTGLNQQGKQLSAAMNTLRRSSAGASFNSAFKPVDSSKPPKTASTYMETDLDTKKSSDLSQVQEVLMSYQDVSPSHSSPTVTVRTLNSSNQLPLQEAPMVHSHITTQESGLMPDQVDPDTDQWDIGDADDNTKRFYGIIPREKPKVLTVRDVKRQSEQRKERDKIRKEPEDNDDSWNGYDSEQLESRGYNSYATDSAPGAVNGHPIYENLPPSDSKLRKAKSWSSVVPNFSNSEPSSRRSSLLYLVTPRPFVPFGSQPSSVGSDFESQSKIYAPSSTSGSYRLGMSDDDKVVKATRVIIQPELKGSPENSHSPTSPPLRTGMYNVKRTPKGRYMTVSSSEPAKRETSVIERAQSLHSSAGDLITNRAIDPVPDIVQSSRTRDEQVDLDMIDKEILFVPEKVLIPERYNPDSDDDDVTEEEQLRRQEKAEKIKRLLTQQSLHSLSQPDVSKIPGDLHQQVEKEKVKRAQLLDIGQELARQVKIKTRQAAAERRKTWSGSPSKVSQESTLTNGFGYEGHGVPLYNGHSDYSKERLFI